MDEIFVSAFNDELEKIAKKGGIGTALKYLGVGGGAAAAGVGGEKLLEGGRKRKKRKEFRKFMSGRRAIMGGGPQGGLRFMVSRKKGEVPGSAGKTLHGHLTR
jgi:hypothetical protein